VFYQDFMALQQVFKSWPDHNSAIFDLVPQFELVARERRMRLDFAVFYQAHNLFIAVELDGHDYHERTKEQVANGRDRDRCLLWDGWTPLHFTGSEIHRDPRMCSRVTWQFAMKRAEQLGLLR
jgi:very-short-patch-repair endonuclease